MSALAPYFDDGQVSLYLGDCLDVLAGIPDCSIDSIVTDPPYALTELPLTAITDALGAWLGGDRAYIPKTGPASWAATGTSSSRLPPPGTSACGS